MVRRLALIIFSALLFSACGIHQMRGLADEANIVILSPNGGADFSTRDSSSVTVSGTCAKSDVLLRATPSVSMVNNCKVDGTWSFETGKLNAGHNRVSISGVLASSYVGANEFDGKLHVNGLVDDIGFDINLVVSSFAVMVIRDTFSVDETVRVRAAFYDENSIDVRVSSETADHTFTWSIDDPIATFLSLTGDLVDLTGDVAGTSTITATLDMDNYTGNLTASKDITVTGGPAPLTCEELIMYYNQSMGMSDCGGASDYLDGILADDCYAGNPMGLITVLTQFDSICTMTCEQRSAFVEPYLDIGNAGSASNHINTLAGDSSCYDVCVDISAYYNGRTGGSPPIGACTP